MKNSRRMPCLLFATPGAMRKNIYKRASSSSEGEKKTKVGWSWDLLLTLYAPYISPGLFRHPDCVYIERKQHKAPRDGAFSPSSPDAFMNSTTMNYDCRFVMSPSGVWCALIQQWLYSGIYLFFSSCIFQIFTFSRASLITPEERPFLKTNKTIFCRSFIYSAKALFPSL